MKKVIGILIAVFCLCLGMCNYANAQEEVTEIRPVGLDSKVRVVEMPQTRSAEAPSTITETSESETQIFQKVEASIKTALLSGADNVMIFGMNIPTSHALYELQYYSPYFGNGIDLTFYYMGSYYYKIQISNPMTIAQTRSYFNRIDSKVAEIKARTTSSMTEFEKALVIHDYFASQAEYDYENLQKGTIPDESFQSAGIIDKGIGVCQAYAYAYKYMMDQLGMECYVTSSNAMNHAWNIVKINGSYFHADTTWDDPVPDIVGKSGHEYFLKSDSYMAGKGYSGWDRSYLKCSNTSYDNAFWSKVDSPMVVKNHELYYVLNRQVKKSTATGASSKVLATLPLWNAPSGGYYVGDFSGLSVYDSKLYYNTAKEIRRMNLDGTGNEIFQKSQNSAKNIYGSVVKASTLHYVVSDTPNSSVKTKYQVAIKSTPVPSEPDVESNTNNNTSNSDYLVQYRTHVQNYGWQDWKMDGQSAGTSGESKRLEAIEMKLNQSKLPSSGIRYQTHVQNYGWQGWKTDGQLSGTSGESKRLEAIRIELTGNAAKNYDIYYRVHAQQFGWMGWAKNGESAGTAGYSYRLEAIEIKLVEKGKAAPGATAGAFRQESLIQYQTHVQNYGWQDWKKDGALSGTSGESKRLEAIRIKLSNPLYSGSVEYQTHVQNYGWESVWKKDGALSGTSGESKRLEAIRIRLTGAMAENYDIYYRVHAQQFGWMGWAKNGEEAGTAGYGYRLEAIQIMLVPKGQSAPGITTNHFASK